MPGAVLSNILLDWEEDDLDSTPPDEDPYRPEAFMDNSGAQLFVIYDCICNGLYIQEVLTHLIKCDVTLFFIVLSLCL